MKSPAMNSPAPSIKKHRSASPSHAMPMSARMASTALDDVGAILFDERIGLVVRKRAVHFETEPWRPAGSRSKSGGAMNPATPLPASRTTFNAR